MLLFTGALSLVAPQFITWAQETYGVRGTFLLIAGISMQNIVAMVLFQPVSWHMKRIEVPENEENGNLLFSNTILHFFMYSRCV